MSRKIISVYDTVKDLLTVDFRLRDDTEKLVSRVWFNELAKQNIDANKLSAYDFFCLYAANKVTNSDSITRASRRVQEKNSHLRGASWYQRQQQQHPTKQEIKTLH